MDESVYFHLELHIGESGVDEDWVFQILVSTHDGIERHHRGGAKAAFESIEKRNEEMGKSALIVIDDYSFEKLMKRLESIVISCERNDPEKSLLELRKHFFWEYEQKK